MMGLEPNQAVYDNFKASFEPKLDVLDKILAKQKYMGGDASLSLLLPISSALIAFNYIAPHGPGLLLCHTLGRVADVPG
jgi:hypothetical protein